MTFSATRRQHLDAALQIAKLAAKLSGVADGAVAVAECMERIIEIYEAPASAAVQATQASAQVIHVAPSAPASLGEFIDLLGVEALEIAYTRLLELMVEKPLHVRAG